MSESRGRCASPSSVSSFSLVEVKAETHLVLQAFLCRTLDTPDEDRPGTVGGAYRDHNKYSHSGSKPQPKPKKGLDSQAEDASSAEEKKSGLKELMKQLPRRYTARRPAKGARDGKDEAVSPSSSSEDEDGEKRQQKKKMKQKKIRQKLSKFFRLKLEKEKNKEARPATPEPEPEPPAVSPSHPPQFYEEVAEKLEKIAQRSHSLMKPSPTAQLPSDLRNKEVVVQQLIQVLSMEGDSINTKIQSDPFLRASLARLSYASFARLLDTLGSCRAPEAPATAPPSSSPSPSPTLRRMAVSMEVSRRIVTATGAVRMQGYAECYMETFAPWVKSHGGWENVDLEEHAEYD